VADRLNIDLAYYLGGGSLLLADETIVTLWGLITTWCFSADAPKEVYGGYGYISAFLAMLGLVALPGLSQAIQRSAARGYDGAFQVGMRQRLYAGGVGSLLMAVIAVVLYARGDHAVAKGALIAGALFPFSGAMDDYRSVLFGKQRFGLYLLMHTGIQTCVSVATIAAILWGFGLPSILFANLVTRSLGNALSVLVMRRAILRNQDVDPDFRRFGWNLSLIGIVGGISYHLDRVIVGATLGLETMAAYELSFRLTEPLRSLGVFVNRLVFPRAARVSGAAVARRFLSRTGVLCLLLGLIGVVVAVVLGPLMQLFFPKYPEAIKLIQWMMWSSLITVPLIYLETFYLTQERFVRTYYVFSTVRPVAIIAALPYMTAQYGALGAIWTKLVVRLGESLVLCAKLLFDWGRLRREEGDLGELTPPLGPVESTWCPLCGDARVEALCTVPDRLHHLPGRFSVGRCQSCGLVRSEPRVTPGAIGRYYPADYQPHASARPPALGRGRTHALRRQWLAWLTAGRPGPRDLGWVAYLRTWPARWFGLTTRARFNPLAFDGGDRRLLDVGCASGDFLLEMQSLGWRVAGIEPSASAAAMARTRGLSVTTGSFPEADPPLAGPFDAITMRQVIEHVPDPLAVLRRARESLAPGGVLMLTTPLADGFLARLAGPYWYPLDQPRHYALFGRRQLAAALRMTGFRVAAVFDHSSTTSWTRSLAYWLAHTPVERWAARLDRRRGVHRMVWPLVRALDWCKVGDGAVVLAVRDDWPSAGWAPREIRDGLVR
jgi:O-antigen/teichoic acid export membrane protein/SAM-dependent methyltransferase